MWAEIRSWRIPEWCTWMHNSPRLTSVRLRVTKRHLLHCDLQEVVHVYMSEVSDRTIKSYCKFADSNDKTIKNIDSVLGVV